MARASSRALQSRGESDQVHSSSAFGVLGLPSLSLSFFARRSTTSWLRIGTRRANVHVSSCIGEAAAVHVHCAFVRLLATVCGVCVCVCDTHVCGCVSVCVCVHIMCHVQPWCAASFSSSCVEAVVLQPRPKRRGPSRRSRKRPRAGYVDGLALGLRVLHALGRVRPPAKLVSPLAVPTLRSAP